MIVISYLIIIIHTFLSCRNLRYGLVCFMAVRVLVPEIVRSPIASLSLNSFLIVVLAFLTAMKGQLNINQICKDRFGKFLLLFMGIFLFMLPFSEFINISAQVSAWMQFLLTDVMPALLAICIIKTKKDLDVLLKCCIYTMFIVVCYGLLTFVINSNPWNDYVESYFPRYSVYGTNFEAFDYTLQTRCTKSTFASFNCFGYYLTYIFTFVLMLKNKLHKSFFLLSSALSQSNMLFSTKRSPIVVLMFIILFLTWHKRNWILPIISLIVIFFIALFTIPALSFVRDFFMTAIFFWDDSYAASLDIGGSNMELRIRQVLYPFIEIKNNPIFGHGFGWCSTYLEIHKDIHPILFGFETIFATVICEGGLLGIVLYSLLFINAYKYIQDDVIDTKINFALLFVLSILLLYIATGIQYMYFFFILLVILHKSTCLYNYQNKKTYDAANINYCSRI